MLDLETVKQENETLKNQMQQNSQGIQNLMVQIDALKGELVDARSISMQLRINLITTQQAAKYFQEQNEKFQTQSGVEEPAVKEISKKGK